MTEPKGIHRRITFNVTDDLRARFWRRVEKQDQGCWLWLGAHRNGYGAIKHDGKVLSPHVVSYAIHHGDIPPGKIICHTCDNRLCVSPDHLYAGDLSDNARDMFDRRKIGAARGVECGNAVLTEDVVRRAWALRLTRGWGARRTASQLGVSCFAIHHVFHRGGWSHVPKPTEAECRQIAAAEAELEALGVR